ITSEALITKLTQPFTLMPSSSTASLVIEDVTIFPPMSTRTCEVVAPFLTATTTPLMWLRALMRMVTYHQFSHAHSFSRSKLRPRPLGARLHRETDIALCMFGGNQIISRQPSR